MKKPFQLNLGCGNRPLKDSVNHDREKFADHVDVSWDMETFPWPRQEKLFDCVFARDVLEHISPRNFYSVMNEIWDLLRPEGLLGIQVPKHGSKNAIIDPTHWRGFDVQSFDYLDPSKRLGKACWTTSKRWAVVEARELPRTDVNLSFKLRKIP